MNNRADANNLCQTGGVRPNPSDKIIVFVNINSGMGVGWGWGLSARAEARLWPCTIATNVLPIESFAPNRYTNGPKVSLH